MSRSSVCPLFRTDSASSPPSRIEYFGSVRTSFLHVLSRALRNFNYFNNSQFFVFKEFFRERPLCFYILMPFL